MVALRKESVDRNDISNPTATLPSVALRKESVDRNPPVDTSSVSESTSLSARRAWIEIMAFFEYFFLYMSLSARRAWIEMLLAMLMRSPIGGRSPQGERG